MLTKILTGILLLMALAGCSSVQVNDKVSPKKASVDEQAQYSRPFYFPVAEYSR